MSKPQRKKISFYAEKVVETWHEGLDEGAGSREINKAIKQYAGLEQPRSDKTAHLEKRLEKIEKLFEKLLKNQKIKP